MTFALFEWFDFIITAPVTRNNESKVNFVSENFLPDAVNLIYTKGRWCRIIASRAFCTWFVLKLNRK